MLHGTSPPFPPPAWKEEEEVVVVMAVVVVVVVVEVTVLEKRGVGCLALVVPCDKGKAAAEGCGVRWLPLDAGRSRFHDWLL